MARSVRFVIAGNEYTMRPVGAATLRELMQIKSETGMGAATVERLILELGDMTGADLLDSVEHMQAFEVQVWLARHATETDLHIAGALPDAFGDLLVTIEDDSDEGSDSSDPQ